MERTVNGVTYVSQSKPNNRCKGCAADEPGRAVSCFDLPHCKQVIFVRKLDAVSTSEAVGPMTDSVADTIGTPEQHEAIAQALGFRNHEYVRGYKAAKMIVLSVCTKIGNNDLSLAVGRALAESQPDSNSARPHFTPTALARVSDPTTSKAAAESMTRKAGKIVDVILTELYSGNFTGKQLSQRTGIPLNSITPRFANLHRTGVIHAASGSGRETVWALGNGVKA